MQRLYDCGLLKDADIDNTVIRWTKSPNNTKVGYCYSMMRTIAISCIYDNERISEKSLDHVVYHEFMHIRRGFIPFNHHPHDAVFQEYMSDFPRMYHPNPCGYGFCDNDSDCVDDATIV